VDMTNQTEQSPPPSSDKSSALTLAHIIYLLQALGLISGITAVIGVIMSYVKIDDVRGTWLESHFRWQIHTFWFGLLFFIVGWLTFIFIVGYIVWFIGLIWYVYRFIKGWIRLSDGNKMYA